MQRRLYLRPRWRSLILEAVMYKVPEIYRPLFVATYTHAHAVDEAFQCQTVSVGDNSTPNFSCSRPLCKSSPLPNEVNLS